MVAPPEARRLNTGEYVELFEIDATELGGIVFRFTQNTIENAVVSFGGNPYFPADIQADGFEYTSQGQLPEPRLRVTNAQRVLVTAIHEWGDLMGAKVTRLRTFRKYLDGQPAANSTIMWQPDVYYIGQLVTQNKAMIEFKLVSVIDLQGVQIPRRQIIARVCTHIYRRWLPDDNKFDYVGVSCPYTASRYYTKNGETTTNPAEDVCGKLLRDCGKRFGNRPLPTRAFPSAGKNR